MNKDIIIFKLNVKLILSCFESFYQFDVSFLRSFFFFFCWVMLFFLNLVEVVFLFWYVFFWSWRIGKILFDIFGFEKSFRVREGI